MRHVFNVRFGADYVCPRCGRTANWAISKGRRMLVHRTCKMHISPFASTAMGHSRIPTLLWFYAMLHIANSVDGVTASFLSRQLGIDCRSAQRMLYRIRLHLAAIDKVPITTSDVSAYVRLEQIRGAYISCSPRLNVANLLLVASENRVRTLVIDRSRPGTARSLVRSCLSNSLDIVTDCYRTARFLDNFREKRTPLARFSPELFEGHRAAATHVTAFLTYFRLGLRSRQQHVHQKHLWLYLREYEFRFNRRDAALGSFPAMISAFPDVSKASAIALQSLYSDYRE